MSITILPRFARTLAFAALGCAMTFGTADTADAQRRSERAGGVWTATAQRGQKRIVTPRVHRDTFVPRNHRARGHYENRTERVWVPGHNDRVWVPARYEWRYDPCGRRTRVMVCAGHYDNVWHPGYYDVRTVRVWVPARAVRDTRGQRRGRVTRVGRRYR